MDGSVPTTVEEIFDDYQGRRGALVKALTSDVAIFAQECDPEKDNLCLYGLPDAEWKVSLPVEEVPPELPEPALGINFARDGMKRSDWLALVAVHSDAWLYSVAFYHAARLHKADRKRLFDMMNNLPTLHDVLTKPPKKPSGKSRKTSNKPPRQKKEDDEEEDEAEEEEEHNEEEDDDDEAFCGICAGPYSQAQFWIGCDSCQKWYHGSCVKVNASKAAGIKSYHCPSCVKKKPRH